MCLFIGEISVCCSADLSVGEDMVEEPSTSPR